MSRVLYIDPFLPLYDRASGSLRLYRILQLLREDGHEVSFMPHTIWAGQEGYAHDLMRLGIEVLAPPAGTHNDATVTAALSGRSFDTVIISFYNFASSYGPFVRQLCSEARIVIDTIDLHFVRERRQAETTNDSALAVKAEVTHRNEIDSYATADALIAISSVEQQILQTEVPGSTVYVVPNVHEIAAEGPTFDDRNGLVFVGNFWHPPNSEGIVWFCNEVWPRVVRRCPSMTLDIIGQDPPSELMRFLNDQVRVHGWVHSVVPFLNNSRLSIAPLLHGAGLKGKVGEALAAGLPVVTTSIGAEGLGLKDGFNAMVADGAEAFANAIVTAHQNAELWQMLSINGREVIRRAYTPDAVRAAVRNVIPAPSSARVTYFGVPDWNNEAELTAVMRNYIQRHQSSPNAALHLGVWQYEPTGAFEKLAAVITNLGYDPETIPDVTLSPLTSLDLNFLNADTIWVPLSSETERPTHVVSTFDFTAPVNH